MDFIKNVLLSLLILMLVIQLIAIPRAISQLPLPPDVKREEVLILDTQISRVATPDDLMGWRIGGNTVTGFHQLCLDVLWYVNFTSGELVPIIAEGMPKYNEDYTVLTVKIKKGITWSDGHPLTAWDFVYGINTTKANSNLAAYSAANAWIEYAVVVDDYTFVVKLKRSNPYWHFNTLAIVGPAIYNYVMPKHYFEAKKLAPTDVHTDKYNPPLCIGQYVLHSYDPGGTWYLWKRRDDWVNSSLGWFIKAGKVPWPGPKYVMFRVFPSETEKIIAMTRMELDWIFDATPQAFEAVKNALGDKVGAWYPHWPYFWGYPTSNRGIYFNNMRYPYNISAVRWALAFAINMTRVLTDGYKGTQRAVAIPIIITWPLKEFWEPKFLPIITKWKVKDVVTGVTLPPDIAEKDIWDPDVAIRVLAWGKANGYLEIDLPPEIAKDIWGSGWWKYMPDVAEAILKALGFRRGPDGKWLLPDGTPWKMQLNIPSGFEMDAVQLGQFVAEEWRRFGIDVEVVPYEAATFWTDQFNYGRFSVGSYWGISGNDPYSIPVFLDGWRCAFVKPIGNYSANAARYCNPTYDEYVLKALASPPGSQQMIDAVLNAVITFMKDQPVIWMGNCKKLQPLLLEYWTNWPTAYNFYWGQDFWGKQTIKLIITYMVPRKVQMDIVTTNTIVIGPDQPLPEWAGKDPRVTVVQKPIPYWLLPTETRTPTPSPSPTPTTTPVETPTVTGVTTITITTISIVERTTTTLSTVLVSTTIRETDWTMTMLLAVVLFVVGFAISWFIKKK
ncbi:MAG: ABC transporter substrate-binding protein [Ignisphaera sp.]